MSALCCTDARAELHGNVTAELRECDDRIVLALYEPSFHRREAGRPEQFLGLVLCEPAPPVRRRAHAAGGGRDLAQAGGVGRALPERGRAGQPGSQAGHSRHAGVHELERGGLVEQLGQGRGDHHRRGRRGRALRDAPPHRGPRAAPARVGRLVVEDEDAVDGRVLPDRDDDVAQPLGVAPDQRRVVERVADRGGVGKQVPQPRGGLEREQGKRQTEPRALVGRERRVTAGAGENRDAPAKGSDPFRRVVEGLPGRARRPRRTASAFASSSRSCRSAAQAAPASSTSALNTRWSPASAPVCAVAAAAPAVDSPTFSTATPTPRSAHSARASHRSAPSPSPSR